MTVIARRVVPLLALAIVLGAIVRRQRLDRPSADTWFHLRMGAEFRGPWSVAHPGHLGRYDSAEWVPTQWLAQLGMSWLDTLGGIDAVMWGTGLVQMLLVVVVYLTCRATTGALPAAAATALAVIASAPGLSARPQVVSYLFVAITLQAWLATARDGKVRWWLVGLTWLWAPLHGMWPVGIVIGAVAVTGIALDHRWDRARIGRLAAVPLLSAVVVTLTPIGLGVYRSLVTVGGRAEYFAEWGPTDFTSPYSLIILVMLAVAVVDAARHRPGWLEILLLLLAAGWAVYSMRTTPVAALLAAPLLAGALQRVLPEREPPTRVELSALAGIVALALALLAVVLLARPEPEVVPGWVDRRMSELTAGSGVLDEWDSGSYFLWKHPDLDLVMHGYADVFTDAELERNADIRRLAPGWDEQVERLDVDAALVDPDSPLGYALLQHPGWRLVEQDADFAFLLPAR